MSDSEQFLTVTPLGGLGEIGLNCQLWETSAGVVMVDCGLMFPDDFHLGVDVVIPHFGAVSAVRDKLLGIVLTHGHEDHIGALPWLVPQLRGTRIYGSYFTLALVEHKLREHELLDWVELCPVEPGDQVALGDMTFHFFPVCHSIPEGFGLGVETPVGRIVHSGDFKIDPQPLAGSGTDLATFRDFAGPEGARLLFSDSTNVERDGRSLTERAVMESLGKVFDEAPGRIVVTLFSSHIQRIQRQPEGIAAGALLFHLTQGIDQIGGHGISFAAGHIRARRTSAGRGGRAGKRTSPPVPYGSMFRGTR